MVLDGVRDHSTILGPENASHAHRLSNLDPRGIRDDANVPDDLADREPVWGEALNAVQREHLARTITGRRDPSTGEEPPLEGHRLMGIGAPEGEQRCEAEAQLQRAVAVRQHAPR